MGETQGIALIESSIKSAVAQHSQLHSSHPDIAIFTLPINQFLAVSNYGQVEKGEAIQSEAREKRRCSNNGTIFAASFPPFCPAGFYAVPSLASGEQGAARTQIHDDVPSDGTIHAG